MANKRQWTEFENPDHPNRVHQWMSEEGVVVYVEKCPVHVANVETETSSDGPIYRSYIENPENSTVDEISIGPDLPIGPFRSKEHAIHETAQWVHNIETAALDARTSSEDKNASNNSRSETKNDSRQGQTKVFDASDSGDTRVFDSDT